MSAYRTAGRVLDRIVDVTTVMGGIAVVVMMFHIVIDVACRFLFSSPLPGTITVVSNYYMIIATFIPLAAAEKLDAHISVEVVYDLLPGWLKLFAVWLSFAITVAVFALIAAKSWQVAVEQFAIRSKMIQGNAVIPIWPSYFVVPFSVALMLVMLVAKAARLALRGGAGRPPAAPSPVEPLHD